MVTPRTMPGVLELTPLEQVSFQRMVDTIRRVYARYGFLPIETPAIELTEVLLTKTGGETERQVYLVQSTGARDQGDEPDLALRFDLTVPLARYVAEHEHELVFPFRRYQIQPVYRGESPQRGRFREFYQCDVDVIARDELPLQADAEMPAVIWDVFRQLDLGAFTVRINNRRLMRGLLAELGAVDDATQSAALRELDKLEKRGPEDTARALTRIGVDASAAERLLELTGTRVAGAASVEALDKIGADHPASASGAAELATVMAAVADLGVPDHAYALDLAIARGLDYYTGTVYETVLDDHPGVGSVCSGGRYDDLAGLYTSSRLPGVGISIGLTRLFWQLRELGLVGPAPSTTEAYVTIMDDEGVAYALEVAHRLRAAGIPTETALKPTKLGRQLKRADRAGIRFALIAGSDERSRGTVTIRDLANQVQDEVDLDLVADHVRTRRS